jgi:hypothetical protein
MKKIIFTVGMFIAVSSLFAQKYITKNGHIKFYSETPMETIEAHNRQVNSALDISTGDFVFKVLIKSFEFEKALMQEHFNENYMESDKIPDATFNGKITNLAAIDFTKDGKYNADIEGDLKIHGVTQKVNHKGTFEVAAGKITGKSVFIVLPADYKIKIPNTVVNNIAKEIQVTVDVNLEPLKK